MKIILITLTFCLSATAGSFAHGQSIFDLTEQLALDAQKLASLKSTLQDMYQSYEDLQKGYTRIRDIAKGNFNLHEAFLDGLWLVSPAVRDDPRITEIVNTEYRIVTAYQAAARQLGNTPVFTAQELDYITGTFAALLQRSLQSVDELTMIVTDNALRMSDAQRLQAINRIDGEMHDNLRFLQQFNDGLFIQAAQRQKEAGDINTLKSLYGLPN